MSDIPNQQNIDQKREASQNPARQQQGFNPVNIANNYNLSKEAKESFTRKFEHGAQRVATDNAIRLKNQQDKQDEREINIRRNDILTEATIRMASGDWGNDQEAVVAGAIAWHGKISRERHASGRQIINPSDLNNIINRGRLIHTKTKGQLLYEEALVGLNSKIDPILAMRDKDLGMAIEMEGELRSVYMELLEKGVEKGLVDNLIGMLSNAVSLAKGDEVSEDELADDKFRRTVLNQTLTDMEEILSSEEEGKYVKILEYLQDKEAELRLSDATEKQIDLFVAVTSRFRDNSKDKIDHVRQGRYNVLNNRLEQEVLRWSKMMTQAKDYDDAMDVYSKILDEKLDWNDTLTTEFPDLSAMHRAAIGQDMYRMFGSQVENIYSYFRDVDRREQTLTDRERQDIRWLADRDPEKLLLEKLTQKIALRDVNENLNTYEDRVEAGLIENQNKLIKEYRTQHQGLVEGFTIPLGDFDSLKINNAVSVNFSEEAASIVQSAINILSKNPLYADGTPVFVKEELIAGGERVKTYFNLLKNNFSSALISAQDSLYGSSDDGADPTEPEDEVLEQAMNNAYPKAVEITLRALQESYENKTMSSAMYQLIKNNIELMKNPLGGNILAFGEHIYSNGIRITTPPSVQVLDLDKPEFYSSNKKFLGPPIPDNYRNRPIIKYGDSYFVQEEDGMYELDNSTPEGKMVIDLYNYAAEEEADFFNGMIRQEREGDPIKFLMSDITGEGMDGRLKNLVGVPLFSPEIVGEDMPVPKSRWDRMVDTAFEGGLVTTKEAQTLETLKGMMFSMSQEQGLNPYDKELEGNIEKILRAAVEMLYTKETKIPIESSVEGVSHLDKKVTEKIQKGEFIHGILEGEFYRIRSPEEIQKELEELLAKYPPTNWRGERVTHEPFTFFNITPDPVELPTAQATTQKEIVPEAETEYISKSATLGMERKQESKGPGADVPPREKPVESYVGVSKK
ncbi:MAG: hypothetical protein Unbinned6201contig1000_23 [Prokaryotic dsDNA virus sp.]|nr:MAG: hypothetical protein Unbinned6201contig1000_23 [Prokaryotic dsDNA virus sp.]